MHGVRSAEGWTVAWKVGCLGNLLRMFLRVAGLAAVVWLGLARDARADIGVVVDDPTTIGVSWFTHAGHSLVYLSDVCAASPVRARLCRPGEAGSVVSMYPDFHEVKDYAWNIVPLNFYLEGLQTPGDRLLYGSEQVKAALELHARVNALYGVCGDHGCPQQPHAYWRDMVAATVDRDMFIYAVHTSRAQDAKIVAWLNDSTNRNRYNSLTNNCSNFTSALVNMVFPHSVHRDLVNDLGMMSPKGAAHSFTHWAARRPELGLYTLHFAQQPGPMPRGGIARSGTEDGFHMKKYLIPAALIGDHEVAGSFFVAYYLTGRFGLYKQYAKYAEPSPLESASPGSAPMSSEPAVEDADYVLSAVSRHSPGSPGSLYSLYSPGSRDQPQTHLRGRAVLGTPAQWAQARHAFAALVAADAQGWKPDRKQTFPRGFAKARAWVDGAGRPYLTIGAGVEARTVGVSSGDLLSAGSDPLPAYQLMLGRVESELDAKNHYRESIVMFRRDWALLLAARDKLQGEQSAPGAAAAIPTLAAQR
jgi:hypothetical protein